MPRAWVSVLALAALMGATAARAEEAVSTAPATPVPAAEVSTAAQIEQFIRSAPMPDIEDETPNGITPGEKRQVHGEVSVGIGTGGYRSFSALSVIPVGETGTLAIAVSQSRNAPYAHYGEYADYGGYGGYGRGERQSIGLQFSSQGDAPRCSARMDRGPDWRRLGDRPGERACSNDERDLAR